MPLPALFRPRARGRRRRRRIPRNYYKFDMRIKEDSENGFLTLRVPKDLLERLRKATKKTRRSISEVLRELIRRYIEAVESL